jgi:hypothetical protein
MGWFTNNKDEKVEPNIDLDTNVAVRMAQPKLGGQRTNFRVAGVWDPEGGVTKVNDFHIEIEGHSRSYGPGDVLPLTRIEATVIGKRYALTVVED